MSNAGAHPVSVGVDVDELPAGDAVLPGEVAVVAVVEAGHVAAPGRLGHPGCHQVHQLFLEATLLLLGTLGPLLRDLGRLAPARGRSASV